MGTTIPFPQASGSASAIGGLAGAANPIGMIGGAAGALLGPIFNFLNQNHINFFIVC